MKKINVNSDRAFYVIVYLICAIAFIVTLYPFIYIISVSVSSAASVNRGEVLLWPIGFSIDSYKLVLTSKGLSTAYGNTILYTVAGTFLNIIATVLTAYPLSRKTFFAKRFFNFFIVFVMYFSGGLIPTYLLITKLGFYNSRWVMIIPGLISSYNVMICRSAFSAVPEEVTESASIDGANDFHILWRIAVRLITPTLAVLTLYYAVGHWNSFMSALLYLSKEKYQPLQILLRRVLLQGSPELSGGDLATDSGKQRLVSLQIRYVTIVVATLPILAVYPFLQKYFVKGVMLGAVKG